MKLKYIELFIDVSKMVKQHTHIREQVEKSSFSASHIQYGKIYHILFPYRSP